jgi:hypothetical protein
VPRDDDFSDPDEAPFIFEAFAEASTPNVWSSGFVDRSNGSDGSMVVDGEGAELPGGRSGEFTTSATSNLGIPDVVNFDLMKGRAFYSPRRALLRAGWATTSRSSSWR